MATAFRVLTPDARFEDDAVVEREIAGPDIHFDLYRERNAAAIPETAFRQADASLVWHIVPTDAAALAKTKPGVLLVNTGRGGPLTCCVNSVFLPDA